MPISAAVRRDRAKRRTRHEFRSRTRQDRSDLRLPPPGNASRPGPTNNDRPSSSGARDAGSRGEETHSRSRLTSERLPAVGNKRARTLGTPGSSQIGATPSTPVLKRLIGQGIQTPIGDISLELAVPGQGVKLGEPDAECGHFLVGEITDRVFDFGDGTYGGKVSLGAARGKIFASNRRSSAGSFLRERYPVTMRGTLMPCLLQREDRRLTPPISRDSKHLGGRIHRILRVLVPGVRGETACRTHEQVVTFGGVALDLKGYQAFLNRGGGIFLPGHLSSFGEPSNRHHDDGPHVWILRRPTWNLAKL